ncbi:MAG: hypothetical protein WCF23_02740, partial [Candidatus Nitrosopolaris sp.]
MKYHPAKKIIFVFLVLTLVSSVSTITFVTGNVNLAFAKKHDSSGSSGGSSGSSSDNSGGNSPPPSDNSQPTPPSSNSNPPAVDCKANPSDPSCPPPSSNSNPPTAGCGPGTDNSTCPTTAPSSPTPTSGCGPGTDNSTCSTPPTPTPTTTNAAQQTCPPLPLDANGNCPTSTSSTQQNTATPCPDGSTPDANGNCPITTPSTQETAPPHTLAQQTCPPLPIDANGNCPGVDMRGGGLGLPPAPTPMSTSQQGNCVSGAHMTHGNPNNCVSDDVPYDDGTCPPGRTYIPGPNKYPCSIPPPPPTPARYNVPSNEMYITKLPDGSCPAGYHNT